MLLAVALIPCYAAGMPSTKAIAFGVSLLAHSVAGVACWQWGLHHQTRTDSAAPQSDGISLVLATDEPAERPALPEITTKADRAPLPAPAAVQPDSLPNQSRVGRPRLAKARIEPQPEKAPASVNDADSTVPVPAASGPAVFSVPTGAVAEITNASSGPSISTLQSTAATTDSGPAVFGAAGYHRNPALAYPRLALARGWEGTVLLSVRVSPDGTPIEVGVKETSGHAVLDEAAMAAVRTWQFKPARVDQEAVSSVVEVPIRFHLATAKSR